MHVVQTVIDTMGDVYPELRSAREHIARDDARRGAELSSPRSRAGWRASSSSRRARHAGRHRHARHDQRRRRVPAVRHLRLPDRPHGADGARARLHRRHRRASRRRSTQQRTRSQDERKSRKLGVAADALGDCRAVGARRRRAAPSRAFVGYDDGRDRHAGRRRCAISTTVASRCCCASRRSTPSRADRSPTSGEIVGEGWRVDVDGVRKIDGRSAALGTLDRRRSTSGRAHGARAERPAQGHGAQSHRDASAARGAAPGARRARASGGLARRAGPAALRLHASRPRAGASSSPRSRRS